jgi:hypothetical protein
MSVLPRLFLFYRIFGCFSAMEVKKHHKKHFTKKIVSKSFYQKIDKNPKPNFSRFLFITVFGRISVRREKIREKIQKKKSDPGPFIYGL